MISPANRLYRCALLIWTSAKAATRSPQSPSELGSRWSASAHYSVLWSQWRGRRSELVDFDHIAAHWVRVTRKDRVARFIPHRDDSFSRHEVLVFIRLARPMSGWELFHHDANVCHQASYPAAINRMLLSSAWREPAATILSSHRVAAPGSAEQEWGPAVR
jgi:hypothetical protein